MKKSILIAGAAGLLFAGAASAADAQYRGGHGGHGGHGQHMRGAMNLMMLRAADTNGDNIITRAEFDQLQAETFEWMDRNGDGYLSIEDRSPVHQRLHALREASGDDEARSSRWRSRGEGRRAGAADGEAREGRRGRGMGRQSMDTDGDGRISRAEFMAAAGARFERLDLNSDGQITPDELDAAVERAREGRGSRMMWWRD